MSKVVIFGSSGFIGSRLIDYFKDWEVVTVDRHPKPRTGTTSLIWDGRSPGEWCKALDGAVGVINLSGSPIAVKWTDENKKEIIASRVDSANAVADAIAHSESPPEVWVNSSATGFYGDRGDTVLYESEPVGTGFAADVCQIWEETAVNSGLQVRLVRLRTGLVMGKEGGMFRSLSKLAKFGLGGAAGSGNQWMPWIHLDDLCRLYRFSIENSKLMGPINGSAPEPVRNKDFMSRLRQEVSRPWSPPVPAFALKVVGEISGPDPELLLGSQRAIPRAAIDNGFSWNFPNLGSALADLVKAGGKGAFVA